MYTVVNLTVGGILWLINGGRYTVVNLTVGCIL
jgi:hypothetical protein